MHKCSIFVQIYLLNICLKNTAAGSGWSEKLQSRVSFFKVAKSNFCDFSCHLPPNEGKWSSWETNLGVVRKPMPTFPLAVHWNNSDISNGFLTNRQNIAKNMFFVCGSLRRQTNRSRARDTAKHFTPLKVGVDLPYAPKTKALQPRVAVTLRCPYKQASVWKVNVAGQTAISAKPKRWLNVTVLYI